MSVDLLADTSFFIAATDESDRHHAEAVAWMRWTRQRDVRLVIHAGILLEIGDGFARSERRRIGIRILDALLSDPRAFVVMIGEGTLSEARELYRRHSDKEWGLTDCVSFALMEELGVESALTADRHFLQAGYRALLLEAPPEQAPGQ